MSPGQMILIVYALLLGLGGVMGFVKAGSRPSLIAGLVSAALAVGCVVMGAKAGRAAGMTLSLLLGIFFGYRYALKPKFMPSGLMAIVSVGVLVLLFFLSTGSTS